MQGFVGRRVAAAIAVAVRICLLAGVLGLAGLPQGAAAGGRHASLIVDANTGRVLHAQAADEPRYPASLTKMMTLYIVFELMEQGRLDASTPIKISENAADTAPSRLGLAPGSEIPLGDAIRALITKSANDIAVAVAEHIAGSEAKFARLMTQRARAIGMTHTVFKNPHGLPDPEQITTARDMVTLALRLNDEFPRHYRLFALRAFTYNGTTFRNHNTLLNSFEGTDGIKTGYTAASGFNLAASVRRDGKHVIGAVFGGNSAASRNVLMRALLRRALAQASPNKTREPVLVARRERKATPERTAQRPADRSEATRATAWTARDDGPQLAATPTARRDKEAASQPVATLVEEPRLVRATPIEIARVKPVLVAPRERVARADAAPAATKAMAATDADVTPFALPRGLAALREEAKGAARPSSLEAQAERLQRGQPPLALAATSALPSRPRESEAVHRPVNPRVSERVTDHVQGGFAVQVGAYSSEAEAMRQLQAARSRAGSLLDGRAPVSQPVQHGGKQLYRARFSGFDANSATTTCQELKRRQIECHVAKVE